MSAAGLPAWSEVDGERAKFEAWAKNRAHPFHDREPLLNHGAIDRYSDIAWQAWQARAALASSVQAVQEQAAGVAVPEGYKLVPVEPTPEMIAALAGPGRILPAYVGAKEKSDARIADRYRAMLAASPAATAPAGAGMVPADLIAKLTRIHAALSNACRQYGEVGSRDVDVADWNHRMHEAVRAVGSLLADQPLQAAPSPAPAPAVTDTAVMALREAAKQAVAALVKIKDHRLNIWDLDDDIDALNAALSAQAEPQAAAELDSPEDLCSLANKLSDMHGKMLNTWGQQPLWDAMAALRRYAIALQPAPAPAQPQLSEAEIDALMPEPDGYAAIAPEGTHSIVVPPQDFAKVNGYSIFTREQVHAAVRAAMQQKGGAV